MRIESGGQRDTDSPQHADLHHVGPRATSNLKRESTEKFLRMTCVRGTTDSGGCAGLFYRQSLAQSTSRLTRAKTQTHTLPLKSQGAKHPATHTPLPTSKLQAPRQWRQQTPRTRTHPSYCYFPTSLHRSHFIQFVRSTLRTPLHSTTPLLPPSKTQWQLPNLQRPQSSPPTSPTLYRLSQPSQQRERLHPPQHHPARGSIQWRGLGWQGRGGEGRGGAGGASREKEDAGECPEAAENVIGWEVRE